MHRAAALRLAVVPLAAFIAVGRAGAQAGLDAASVVVTDVEIAFDVERGRPGGTALVRARLRDAAGRAVDAPLHVEADGGTVEAPVRVGQGLYTARVALPTVLNGKRSLLVVAAAGRGSASATLPLAPGPAAELRVETPSDLSADGAAHPLWIGVSDEHGNPSAETPTIEARRGSVGKPVQLVAGGWMFHYRPPRDTRAGEDVVRVKAGGATTAAVLRLAPMKPRVSVGARGGVVVGTGGPSAAFGVEAAAWPWARLGVVLSAAWWSAASDRSVPGPGGALQLRSTRAWLPVSLSAVSRHPLGKRVMASFSLGGGGAVVTSRTTLAGQPAVSEAGLAPVAAAGAELALRMRVGEALVGVQGNWIGDPHLDTLRGSAWPVAALVGYRFHAY